MSSGGVKAAAGGLLLTTTSATQATISNLTYTTARSPPPNSYSQQPGTDANPCGGSGGGSYPPPPPSVIRSTNAEQQPNRAILNRRSVSHSGPVGGNGDPSMTMMMDMLFPSDRENGVGGVTSATGVGMHPTHMKSMLNPLASLPSPSSSVLMEYDGSCGGGNFKGHHNQESPLSLVQQQNHHQIKQQQRLLAQFPQEGGTWSQSSSGAGSYKASSLLDSHDR